MDSKTTVLALLALPFIFNIAAAADRLTEAQMDMVSAGALPSCAGASMCSGVSVTQSSTTVTTTNSNGLVVTTTTNTGPVITILGGATGSTGATGVPAEPANSFPLSVNVQQISSVPPPISVPAIE